MQILNFIPQPFQETVNNYFALKEELKNHPKDHDNVRKAAFKVTYTAFRSLAALPVSCLYAGMFYYNVGPFISFLPISALFVMSPSLAAASLSCAMGLAAVATTTYAIALGSSGGLAIGVVWGTLHYVCGRQYHDFLQKEWGLLNDVVDNSFLLKITGFTSAIYDCRSLVDRLINWTSGPEHGS